MTAVAIERRLRRLGFQGELKRSVLMSDLTSFRIGGPADLILYPRDEDDLKIALSLLKDAGVPYHLLGNGTNLLVADAGVRGALISLSHAFRQISRQGNTIVAGGGVGLPELLQYCASHALQGLEQLAGIPGTVGGGVRMNAGSWGVAIGDRVSYLLVMDSAGNTKTSSRNEVSFGYRGVDLPKDEIILQAAFSLEEGDGEEIKGRMGGYLQRKRETQPLSLPSAGSIFKNPPGIPAGRLIEELGLKGTRRGAAMISPLHANFIVNMGGARARDVIGLIDYVRSRAWQERGIQLELEVSIIGEERMA